MFFIEFGWSGKKTKILDIWKKLQILHTSLKNALKSIMRLKGNTTPYLEIVLEALCFEKPNRLC